MSDAIELSTDPPQRNQEDGLSRRIRLQDILGPILLWAAALPLLGGFRWVAWPRPPALSVVLGLMPIPEILLIASLVLILDAPRWRRRRLWGAGFLLGVLFAWNVGEIIYRWNYREHFFLLDDLALLPSLVSMISRVDWFRRPLGMATIYLLASAVVILLGRGLSGAVELAGSGLRGRRLRRSLGFALALVAVVQGSVAPGETPSVLLVQSVVDSVRTARAVEAASLTVAPAAPSPEDLARAQAVFETVEDRPSFSYPGIADGDIHLLVVESYGHTLFTNPVHRENIAETYQSVSESLASRGWSAASGFLHSPAYGGRSWLADATLLTGRRMENQRIFDGQIYTADPSLSGQMNAAGYRTVYAAPGTRRTPDDWKNYYGFDEYLIEGDMEWNGPFISFGIMSDQYFLDFLGRRYRDSEEPLFLTALMVSSHVPFVFIPEYIEDWNRLGDGSIYRTEGIRRFDNNWLGGSEYPEGYVFSIDYVMKTIDGYIERYVDDTSLVVIVGDHQPRTPISEASATYGVPVHFLSRNPTALEPLVASGLTRGFRPADTAPLLPMEEFPGLLNTVLKPQGALAGYMESP